MLVENCLSSSLYRVSFEPLTNCVNLTPPLLSVGKVPSIIIVKQLNSQISEVPEFYQNLIIFIVS